MIIGIDGNEANVKNRVGIGEYAYELLLEFAKLRPKNIEFHIYLKNKPLEDMPKEFKYIVFGPQKLWTQFALPLKLISLIKKPDVFFSPSHYSPRICPCKTAMSVMDLSYVHFPELFRKEDLYQLKNWTNYSAKKASKIFTISQASKNDIIDYYKVDSQKIVVTYPGIKPKKMSLTSDKKNKKPYILFVGTLQPRKNIKRLIEAFSIIKPKHEDLDLVIVGKKGWLYEEILEAPKKFNVSEDVKFLDFVTDEELEGLYKNAECFVLPSLYEGFGLPVLEAMRNGCPVLTSNISSLPEAGGDAALYFDPKQVKDIADKIEKVLSDKKLKEDMIKKGFKQIKKFSWEKTARETLEALEELSR